MLRASAILSFFLVASTALGSVGVGDRLPDLRTVDEHLRPVEAADLLDGEALVLLYGSAT